MAVPQPATDDDLLEREQLERVFESVSRYFSLMAEPMRVRIMHSICDGERTVGDIVDAVGATQTNVSRHLAALYQADAVYRRKAGNHVFYGIRDSALIALCRGVCIHIASRLDDEGSHSDGLLSLARGFESVSSARKPLAASQNKPKPVNLDETLKPRPKPKAKSLASQGPATQNARSMRRPK